MVSTVVTYGNLTNVNDNVTQWTFNVTTPDSNATSVTSPPWSLLEKMMFGTWLTISMLCAVFGNLMVIVVVIRHKGMRTRTNMFLVNLAVADFLVGILLAPFALTTLIYGDWVFGSAMCHVNGFLNAVCFFTSTHTLMYISIHKYVSITRPFSRILNHWKILVMIGCAWLWAIICAMLTIFILSKVVYKSKTMQCGPEYPRNNLEYLHHTIIQITGIILPLGIMIFAYARMYCEFRQHAVRLRKNTLQSDQILAQQIKVTKTLFIVLACFMLCWLPYAWYSTYVTMEKDKSQIPGWTNALAYCFMYMNSGCNPIIYAWRSPSFREGYKEILCQKSSYIVSDDTIRDSDSPSIIRRLSTLLHSNFRSTRFNSFRRKSSDDFSSLNSPYMSRSASASAPSPTHTLLKRATSKTAKGSSIIRKDGAIIITKNGKIISVRKDTDTSQRDRTLSGFEDIKKDLPNGVSKSVSDINVLTRERLELSPLIKRDRHNSSWNSVPDRCANSVTDTCNNNKFFHSSLSKIDSVDETKIEHLDIGATTGRRDKIRETTLTKPQASIDKSASPSPNSDLDEVFVSPTGPTPIKILFNSQENMLSAMPLEPGMKQQNKFAKSDMHLDTDTSRPLKGKNSAPLSRSSNVVYKVPLLRGPSLERLDVPTNLPRCSSDASSISRLQAKSPLYKRRWLSNKNVDQVKDTKV